MTTVHKYSLEMSDHVSIKMPRGSQLLHVGIQGGGLYLWARVDTDAPRVRRDLRVAGTGHSLGDAYDRPHIGTVITASGALVLHVFDLGEVPA